MPELKPPGHVGSDGNPRVLVNTLTPLQALEVALKSVDTLESSDVYADEETLNQVRVSLARAFAKEEG